MEFNDSNSKTEYIKENVGIRKLLIEAFKLKRKVKIRYYSLSSDKIRYRIIDIYQMHNDCVIAFCHLRNDERTFVMDRVRAAKLLDEKYKIPEGWEPESIILDR